MKKSTSAKKSPVVELRTFDTSDKMPYNIRFMLTPFQFAIIDISFSQDAKITKNNFVNMSRWEEKESES